MAQHLLPCSCGRGVPVSTAQAGQQLHCECGALLAAPTLREIRALPVCDPSPVAGGKFAGRAWTDRHRLAFVLVVIALAGVLAAGYLYVTMPVTLNELGSDDIEAKLVDARPNEAFDLWKRLQQGIDEANPIIEINEQIRTRHFTGMAIAATISGISLAAALAVLLARRRR